MMAVVRYLFKKDKDRKNAPSNFIEVVLESKSDGCYREKNAMQIFFYQAVGAYASSYRRSRCEPIIVTSFT
jgi:hypothetical protein